jgi:hypothetical protein
MSYLSQLGTMNHPQWGSNLTGTPGLQQASTQFGQGALWQPQTGQGQPGMNYAGGTPNFNEPNQNGQVQAPIWSSQPAAPAAQPGRDYAGGNPNFNEAGPQAQPDMSIQPVSVAPAAQPGRDYAGGNPNFNEANPNPTVQQQPTWTPQHFVNQMGQQPPFANQAQSPWHQSALQQSQNQTTLYQPQQFNRWQPRQYTGWQQG